jgi:transposase
MVPLRKELPMYYDFTVPVPRIQGKILKKSKGSTTYIMFQYGQIYKPEKQYVIPQRTIIGKLLPDDKSLMYPNEKYQEFFPDAVMPEERPEAYRSCALRIGTYIIIQKVLNEYAIPQMLQKWLKKDCGLFLDLVSYLIVNEDNAGQYYPDFAFCHPLFSDGMKIYSDVTVSRLLKSIRREQTIGFLDDWNKQRDHKQQIYISYDSSNKNCQAGDVDLVEYGKAKDDKGLPVFNVGVAFDKNHKIPLFYEEYAGSITDVSQFVYMVDKVKEYNYKKIGFILDRGYFSKDNIRYMDANGYPFIIMIKGRKDLVSSLVLAHRNTFETDRDCIIHSYQVYGKTVAARLYEDDTRDRYIHIYFNVAKQAAERIRFEQTLDKMKLKLDKGLRQPSTWTKPYHDLFELKYDRKGNFIAYAERKDVIKKQLELCGYFCVATSNKMTAAEALILYKGRDISEKLFAADKSLIGSKSMRVHSAESLSAKLFLEFIALIVRNRIYNLLKELMLRMETNPNYLTVPAAIRELEKIEMVRRNNGTYRLDHAVSKKQKVILSSFGLSEDDVLKSSNEIGQLLARNKSLIEADELDADDKEEYSDGEDPLDFID